MFLTSTLIIDQFALEFRANYTQDWIFGSTERKFASDMY